MGERVLVVDDDETIRRTLRINLRARGYEVEEVATGRDALATLDDAPADLVILGPTSTVLRCCGACGRARGCRSSSCRRGSSPMTRSRRSTRVPTTT